MSERLAFCVLYNDSGTKQYVSNKVEVRDIKNGAVEKEDDLNKNHIYVKFFTDNLQVSHLSLRVNPQSPLRFMSLWLYRFALAYTKSKLYYMLKVCNLYECWNFNSGNYLFTTDTK